MATAANTITLPSGIQLTPAPATGWRVFVPEELIYDVTKKQLNTFVAVCFGEREAPLTWVHLESGGAETFV